MNNTLTAKERKHLSRVKELPCSVCDAPPPSQAHHIKQHRQYVCVSLCESCHTSNYNGIHGQKRMWDVMKMTEIDALNITLKRLLEM